MGIFHFLLVDYKVPQLLNFLPHLKVVYLVADNSTQVLNNRKHIEFQWYLPELDILQYLQQSFKRKLGSRVLSSDGIETNDDHFEHFIEKYFVGGYTVIACHI